MLSHACACRVRDAVDSQAAVSRVSLRAGAPVPFKQESPCALLAGQPRASRSHTKATDRPMSPAGSSPNLRAPIVCPAPTRYLRISPCAQIFRRKAMTLESRTLEFGLGSGLIADEPRQIATEGTYNLVPDLINEAPAPKMGGSAIRPGDANLLIVIAVLALLAWFADICRRILQLYELSVAVTSGGIVRLEDGRSLAELQMLWGMNMNMRQQLLRARRVSAGVAVSQIQVPLVIKDILCSAHAGADGRRTLRICFDYTGTVACSAQLFWGMEQGAVQRLVRRLNFPASDRRRGRPAGRSLLTLLRQKTPSFRNRYTAVENRETVEGKGEGFLLEASVGFFSEGSRGALFPDHECAGISEPFAVPAGRDRVEKELNLTTRERVGLASNDSVRSGQEAGAQLLILSEGGGNEAGSAIRDSAGMITQSETSAHGNSGEVSLFPLVIAVSFEEGAAGLTARPNHGALGNRYTVSIIVLRRLSAACRRTAVACHACSAASDLEAVDREEVRQLLYVVSAGPAASLLSHLRQTVVVTSKVTYVTQDIYGEDEHEETECIMYVLQCMPLQLFFFLVCILSCQWTLVPLADLLTGYQVCWC